MATEATTDNIATSSALPDHELSTTETTLQDVPSQLPLPLSVNGDSESDGIKQDTEVVGTGGISAEASVSGGSDTEATKAEASRVARDEKGHVRSASAVKKVASFKPVSVNKTFLAAKGTTPAVPSKLGEKAAAGTTAAQTGPSINDKGRPRLIAKSGSGLRDSTPRAVTTANGTKAGAAPDASAVWNKNRPAPPPEPKRFTDEELKVQYGIHLATRLQSDDPNKQQQANWADIDDDDDDWAPETIEWTDGTKITLPQADDTPAPPREPTPIPAVQAAKNVEATKPKSPAPAQAASSPTVKPSGFGSGRAGLVLKGASEKLTLVAKPPGPPTPVKSPWAPLPPVEKVAPVAIDIPQNQQQSRFNQRDPHGFGGMPPPPAKEIAADDFSRSSWREGGHANTSRELYNSQSGRYEPVNDNNRRGSRADHSRQPAVLQRPSHQDGPAEPSAAFQTHRASGQDVGYGRRRTSSNVSGGSGNFGRRMSRGHDMPPPHDMLNARRGSLAAVSDAPSSPRNYSPSGHPGQRNYQNQPWQARASPVVSHPSPQSVHGQPIPPGSVSLDGQPPAPYEDPVEAQKKIMRQTRELAIKRRQEQEAREEAAKQERIRIKLEAMGPPPEKKKKETPKDEQVVPKQIQIRETEEPLGSSNDSSRKSSEDKEKLSPATGPADQKLTDRSPNQDIRQNGISPLGPSSAPPHPSQDGRPWQNPSSANSDRFQSWAPQPSQRANLWGPPTQEKSLGNGTFNTELSGLPEMQSSSHPGPIGPPNRGNGSYQQGRGYGSRPSPIGPPNRQQGPGREQQQRTMAPGWGNADEIVRQDDMLLRQKQQEEEAQKRELREKGLLPDAQPTVFSETYRQVALQDDGTRSKVQKVIRSVDDGSGHLASAEGVPRQVFDDHRQAEAVAQSQFNDPWRSSQMNTSSMGRGSRFFPNRDIRLEDPTTVSFARSASPPPPTMAGHPAYDGDMSHPHVNLPRPDSPLENTKPVVRLPPTILPPIGPPKPASFAAAVSAPVAPPTNRYPPRESYYRGSQDVRTELPEAKNWQDRINSLIGRKSSPPAKHAPTVDSSSKHALEIPNSQLTATVSLPSSVTGDLAPDDSSVTTKPPAEECFEEQEMGSLPVIKVPFNPPTNGWQLASAPKVNPTKFPANGVTSVNLFALPQDRGEDGASTITIKMPYQALPKVVSMPNRRQRSNPKNRGNRSNNQRHTSGSQRGGRGRDTSSGFASPSADSTSMSSSPSGRGGRGGRAGRGNGSGGYDWSRHPPAIQS